MESIVVELLELDASFLFHIRSVAAHGFAHHPRADLAWDLLYFFHSFFSLNHIFPRNPRWTVRASCCQCFGTCLRPAGLRVILSGYAACNAHSQFPNERFIPCFERSIPLGTRTY